MRIKAHLDILGELFYLYQECLLKRKTTSNFFRALDMLILHTLLLGAAHGHAIAKAIERNSEDVLQVEQGSCTRRHRLIQRGWITAQEGSSENNRRAKFYRMTAKGRRQLVVESSRWERMMRAITQVMRPVDQEGNG